MKSAVVYYSRSGVTKKIAEQIKERFGSDMFFVEPAKPYGNYASSIIRFGIEKAIRKPAKVVSKIVDFSSYDVIFIGFPVWYGTMPDFMQEYIKSCAISNKLVIPFATAGANGKESALNTVKSLLKDCKVKGYFYTSISKKGDVNKWLEMVSKNLAKIS